MKELELKLILELEQIQKKMQKISNFVDYLILAAPINCIIISFILGFFFGAKFYLHYIVISVVLFILFALIIDVLESKLENKKEKIERELNNIEFEKVLQIKKNKQK